MANKNVTDMTVGNPTRHILKFTLPLLIGNLFQQAYILADSMIVGRQFGANALAAAGRDHRGRLVRLDHRRRYLDARGFFLHPAVSFLEKEKQHPASRKRLTFPLPVCDNNGKEVRIQKQSRRNEVWNFRN